MHAGKILIVIGLAIVIIGIIVLLAGDKLNWLGNLPGDIKIERDNFKFYAPLVSMLLVSIFVSALIWLFNRFFR